MVVALDPLVMSISGHFGNLVYYPHRNRQYVRRYVIPRNPDTAAQRCRRELFSSAVAAWKNLPLYKKEQWRSKALNGGISGYNLFISRILRQKEDARNSLSDRKNVISVYLNKSLSVPPVFAEYGRYDSMLCFEHHCRNESDSG